MAISPQRAAARRRTRWLAAPIVAAFFVTGVWVAGGLITDDFKLAMALTLVWGLGFGIACVAVAWRRPDLRVPVVGAYLLSAAVVGGFLAWTTLRDRVVHETVATGVPTSVVRHDGRRAPAHENVQLASGRFISLEHESRGKANVVRLANGERRVTLTGFSTSPGPDLRVRVTVGAGNGNGGSAKAKDLGGLKGNKGDQQYKLPRGVDLTRYRTVVIWCRAFSAGFAEATLIPS
ncbi:MAG: DM13 domain-containing protein [Gaiellaceae bacterium]